MGNSPCLHYFLKLMQPPSNKFKGKKSKCSAWQNKKLVEVYILDVIKSNPTWNNSLKTHCYMRLLDSFFAYTVSQVFWHPAARHLIQSTINPLHELMVIARMIASLCCFHYLSSKHTTIIIMTIIWIQWSEVAQSRLTLRPHRLGPTRLLCPWNFLGNSTGVDCHL